MSVEQLVFDVIERARKLAAERGLEHLLLAANRAETVAMIEMWDADLDLEKKIAETAVKSMLPTSTLLPN